VDRDTEPTPAARPGRGWVLALGLTVLTAAVFAPTVRNGFVGLDDEVYVTHNHGVAAGLSADGLKYAFDSDAGGFWLPTTWLSLQLDVTLHGEDPAGFHLTNNLLHALNAVLLFVVLQRATGATGRSFAVALLWAVHPLRVESVAWVTERKDVLSGLFFLLAIAAYIRHTPSGNRVWFYLSVAAFGVGLAAKPMLVTLPCVLLLLDAWPLGRLRSARDLPQLAWEKTPFFLLSFVFSVITAFAQNDSGATHELAKLPLAERAATALVGYGAYLRMTVWPADLGVQYPLGPRPAWQLAAAAGVLAGVTALAVALRRKAPYLTVGWFWFAGMIFPICGLFQVGTQAYADRFTYLPHIGLLVAVVWGAADGFARCGVPVRGRAVVVALLAAACVVQTERQIPHWASARAMWERAVEVSPDNDRAWFELTKMYWQDGDWDRALKCLDEADRSVVRGKDPTYDYERKAIRQMLTRKFRFPLG
jgi:hypothetical protein